MLPAEMGSDGTSDETTPASSQRGTDRDPARDSDEGSTSPDGDQSTGPERSGSPDGDQSTGPERSGSGADDSGETEKGRFAFESYYELLGVPADATTAEIERAYRELAKRHHPDASDEPEAVAERRFRQLLTAREVLTSVERRRAYDELGHEEYRRQSESMGEPVRRDNAGEGPADEPEPRPEPRRSDQPGQAQRSARGEAHRRGDPLVTTAEAAFSESAASVPASEGADGKADGDESASGRGIYRLVFEDGPLESRSLQYVAARWARSWRIRTGVAVGSGLFAAVVLAVLPALLDVAGLDGSVPDPTAGRLSLVALVAAVTYTGYSCGASEARLPRGQFLADRDHGRFSPGTSRSYQRRGVAALAVALALALGSARTGVDPWAHSADTLRGDRSGQFPWFDAPDADWTTALDVILSGVFAVAAVVGTLLLALGVSIALWRGRYEQGLRVRPSLWEPAFVAALVSGLFALATGPTALASVDALSSIPGIAARTAGVDGSTGTTATVATAGIVLLVVSALVLRARAVRAGAKEREQTTEESESG